MGVLKITQIKSVIGCPKDQQRTVRALGLKKIRHTVEQEDCSVIRGMIKKVDHLVSAVEVKARGSNANS